MTDIDKEFAQQLGSEIAKSLVKEYFTYSLYYVLLIAVVWGVLVYLSNRKSK